MENSKYLVAADHKHGINPELRVNLIPYPSLIFMGILGLILVITLNTMMVIFGLIILLAIVYALARVKDRIVTEVYADGVSIFDPRDSNVVHHPPWDEMRDWKFNPGLALGEAIEINMIDNEHFAIESFKSTKIVKRFMKHVPEKELARTVFGKTKQK
ncbi:MAG: hypothetical protein E4G74_00135 [Erysipelotrichales bacterium]|nr:MAG: hypothetical protein E4G74_00135 [Erysipelotrichales bacterium]